MGKTPIFPHLNNYEYTCLHKLENKCCIWHTLYALNYLLHRRVTVTGQILTLTSPPQAPDTLRQI